MPTYLNQWRWNQSCSLDSEKEADEAAMHWTRHKGQYWHLGGVYYSAHIQATCPTTFTLKFLTKCSHCKPPQMGNNWLSQLNCKTHNTLITGPDPNYLVANTNTMYNTLIPHIVPQKCYRKLVLSPGSRQFSLTFTCPQFARIRPTPIGDKYDTF